MKIESGRLDRRIELLQPTTGQTQLGATETSFDVAGRRWAARLRITADEAEAQPQRRVLSRRDYLLRLDSLTAQLTTEWRVRESGATARIIGLDADPRDGSLIVRADQAEA